MARKTPLLPPPTTHPDEPPFACIEINQSWIPYIIGALRPMRYPEYWAGTLEENRTARKDVNNLINQLSIAGACGDMECCFITETTTVILHQVNSVTLQLEISVDGGQTWTPDPESPVNQIASQPSPITTGVSANKCDAATNGKQHIEDLIAACHDQLGTAETVFDLAVGVMEALLVLVIAFFSLGAAAAAAAELAAVIWGAAHAAFDYGIAAFDANWTSVERDKILCALFCHIGDDGRFTESQYNAFLLDWKSHAAINPAFWFVYSALTATGRVGLNNLCSYGNAADADCGSCGCSGCDLSLWEVTFGTDVVRDGNSIIATAVEHIPGDWTVQILSPGNDVCCCHMIYELLSGSAPTAVGYVPCGLPFEPGNISFSYAGGGLRWYDLASHGGAFRVKITADNCE